MMEDLSNWRLGTTVVHDFMTRIALGDSCDSSKRNSAIQTNSAKIP